LARADQRGAAKGSGEIVGQRDKTVTDGFEDKPAAPKAMPQHEVDAQLLREKTARLRALRLAQQAKNGTMPAPVKKKARKLGEGSEKSGGKGVPLSEWLSTQQKEGRRN
jgi:hypothetical protein